MTAPTTADILVIMEHHGVDLETRMLWQAVIAAENRGVTISAITDRVMTTEAGDKHLKLSQ